MKELVNMANLIPFNKRNSDLFRSGFEDFHNMLDDFFTEGWPFRRSFAADTFKIDVQDNETEYVVEAELPGVKKDEVSISLDEGSLRISVKKEENIEEKSKNYIHKERRYSSMSRSVYLADSKPDGIKAKLENGLLSVTIPKKAKKSNVIDIEIE
jgi:HSP20 family protein